MRITLPVIKKKMCLKQSYRAAKPGLVQFNLISRVPVSHSVIETNTIQEDSLIYFSENDLTALQTCLRTIYVGTATAVMETRQTNTRTRPRSLRRAASSGDNILQEISQSAVRLVTSTLIAALKPRDSLL